MCLLMIHFSKAFVNLTSNIREALFKVLLLTLYTDEGNVVLDNGDEVCTICNHGNIIVTMETCYHGYQCIFYRSINGLLCYMDSFE